MKGLCGGDLRHQGRHARIFANGALHLPLHLRVLRLEGGHQARQILARMAPGGEIKPHRDANPAAKWPHKIHVPLLTNDKVTFYIEGTGYHMPEGEAAEVNNMGVHAVKNDGDTDRIHLIFEYFDPGQPAPDWLSRVLAGGA